MVPVTVTPTTLQLPAVSIQSTRAELQSLLLGWSKNVILEGSQSHIRWEQLSFIVSLSFQGGGCISTFDVEFQVLLCGVY